MLSLKQGGSPRKALIVLGPVVLCGVSDAAGSSLCAKRLSRSQ